MTMIQTLVGRDANGNGIFGFGHPFVLGKRRVEQRIPTEITTRKTGVVRQGFRVIPREATIPVINKTSQREIARGNR